MRRLLLLCAAAALGACVEPALKGAPLDAGADAGPYVCTALNCTGCCRNNICRGGNELEACGYDGRRCQECPAGTACVTPGACVAVMPDAGETVRPLNLDAGYPVDFGGNPLSPPKRCWVVLWQWICE